MFKVDDVIVYGTQGVCRIVGLEEKRIGGMQKTYFVIQPVNDRGATIYAPMDNAHVLKKMRRLLTEAEILQLIDAMPKEEIAWIENDNDRKEHYKAVLTKGDHLELIRTLKAIYAHRKERESEGKRLHMSDEYFFKEAQQVLYNEFQYVLKLKNEEDLMAYIFSRIEKA